MINRILHVITNRFLNDTFPTVFSEISNIFMFKVYLQIIDNLGEEFSTINNTEEIQAQNIQKRGSLKLIKTNHD